MRRLINCSKSEFEGVSTQELKASIKASEGRVVLVQNYVGFESLVQDTTNAELSFAFGADMILFNGYPMDGSPISAFEAPIYQDGQIISKHLTLKEMKELTTGPLGIYLECGLEDDAGASTASSVKLIRPERVASRENLLKVKEEGADFVILGGNPGSGTTMDTIVEATRNAKDILGDDLMIWAGKWEDGVTEKVLGDPLFFEESKQYIKKLIDAGADVICLPMPGSRTGVVVDEIRELVTLAHTYKEGALVMNFLDGSVEGSDQETIRECALLSKQTGADIHAIGDAGISWMPVPENIYQLCLTIKGRRLTWLKMATGHR
ncbi:hypothetical protein [Aerococcus tenax]|uniref:DUF7916 family protein n=1 Tax=Aerococcus tenax TaxID=3078812 RepID=UPI0018A79D5E|nr:hypothetical protein [Aerococcus tenax]